MSVTLQITAPTGETEGFRFPSLRVALNATAALSEHGFDPVGLQRWLEMYGGYADNVR